MSLDSDVVVLGTGVAPLIAATRMISEGLSVLILNPDWDFFREDSELPLDPLWPFNLSTVTPSRLAKSLPERALKILAPDFPGAIEVWPEATGKGFRDRSAPHIRTRSRLWLNHEPLSPFWASVEDMYVEASDAGMHPQILEGLVALKRFPGASLRADPDRVKGVLLPKSCDVDVTRYRDGMLEFIRERVDPERIITAASQIELTAEGVRFHSGGKPKLARINQAFLAFWTPRLSPWVLAQAKKAEVNPPRPKGTRLWEEWSLVSRDPVDPGAIGSFEDLVIWAEVEGNPVPGEEPVHRLSVLRAGPLVHEGREWDTPWASAESFSSLSTLCQEFLGWERFTVRALRPRAIFEWDESARDSLERLKFSAAQGGTRGYEAFIVPESDGPLVEVVEAARSYSNRIMKP